MVCCERHVAKCYFAQSAGNQFSLHRPKNRALDSWRDAKKLEAFQGRQPGVRFALLHSLNGFACYHQSPKEFAFAFLVFVATAVLIAPIAVFTANPPRAALASAFFRPWLLIAYYTDCVAIYHAVARRWFMSSCCYGVFHPRCWEP